MEVESSDFPDRISLQSVPSVGLRQFESRGDILHLAYTCGGDDHELALCSSELCTGRCELGIQQPEPYELT